MNLTSTHGDVRCETAIWKEDLLGREGEWAKPGCHPKVRWCNMCVLMTAKVSASHPPRADILPSHLAI